jgi:heavy metal translocating P-type ATPase
MNVASDAYIGAFDKLQKAPVESKVPDTEPEGPTHTLNFTIALIALAGIAVHIALRLAHVANPVTVQMPLWIVLATGGTYTVAYLVKRLLALDFGSDLLAAVTICTATVLSEYLAGSIIVLMYSGGQVLEGYAVRNASSVLRALAGRMPSVAHVLLQDRLHDVPLGSVAVGDTLVLLPHEICPVDGIVSSGRGFMDESYLTGEPYRINKLPGAAVLSGAINGDTVLHVHATRAPSDSRYAQIAGVMEEAQQQRPRMRRIGDTLGAYYTPVALVIAIVAALATGDATRFLAVIVVATPCPLLLGIPVAVIATISLCARRAIIIRDPAALEEAPTCATVIFDKTGTLTYGRPQLSEQLVAPPFARGEILQLAATLEQYSRHPLAEAVMRQAEAENLPLLEASNVSELPGEGLHGTITGRTVVLSSRAYVSAHNIRGGGQLPPTSSGLECVVVVDGTYAATYRFHDEPRSDGASFVGHLTARHQVKRMLLVSGDREEEVRYLGEQLGITALYAGQSPEQKLAIVRQEVASGRVLYIGDGINDAPALLAASVGVAVGTGNDITGRAAGAIILENTLRKVDEFLHISRRMRTVILQSALGGMAASAVGMLFASLGLLTPVAGAILQEVIDAAAVLNALRAATPPRHLTDY